MVVGINKYQNFGPLSFARKDAEDVAFHLIQDLGIPGNQVSVILDAEASRERILTSYLEFINVANSPDDRLVFFFAGHGLTLTGYHGQVGYLVPADGDPSNPATLIRWDDITRNADLIPAKHILFILDACFSGLALQRVAYPGIERFLSDMLQRRARQVITAGKADETVADGGGPEGENSIFTGYLIEGLTGAAISESGVLTASGLMHYVYDKLAHDDNANQSPHYGHIDGDGDCILMAPGLTPGIGVVEDLIEPSPPLPPVQEEDAVALVPIASFAVENGYQEPNSASFGRNDYSQRLGNVVYANGSTEARALSWLSVVFEPSSPQQVDFDLAMEAKRFQEYAPQGEGPERNFMPPREVTTTINSVVLSNSVSYGSDLWGSYVRITHDGNMEYCDSFYSFFTYQDMRAFRYVQIIGMLWQFIFFLHETMSGTGYPGGGTLLVNLVGTRDTILADFATDPGPNKQKWLEPGERGIFNQGESLLELKCPDSNLQMKYSLQVSAIDESSTAEIIHDIARQLGLAYNHQTEPRCFVHGSDEFPWNSYFRKRQ